MSLEIKGAIYEPQAPDEHIRGSSLLLPLRERGGFIFLIVQTKKDYKDSEIFFQTLTDQTRRLADSFGKESNPQHRFEQFLGALNETLAEHVRDGRWHIPIERINAVVGIATEKEMYLAGTGELYALFLHKKPSQQYQVFNLFRSLQTEQSLPTWEKTFAVVLDGDLHPGDVFCVTDKDIQRTIPSDELNHILSSLPPVGAVEKIRQYFPHKESVLLSILKVVDGNLFVQHQAPSSIPVADTSLENLHTTEALTDQLLDEQRPNVSTFFKKLFSIIQPKTDQRSRLLHDIQSQNMGKQIAKRIGRITWRLASMATKYASKSFERLMHLLKNKEERTRVKNQVQLRQEGALKSVQAILNKGKHVPTSQKYLFAGIILAVVLLVFGISTMSKSQAKVAQEKAYTEQLAAIEDLMEQAAGAVIYKDENQARSLYINAQTLIENLPTETEAQQEQTEKLLQNLQLALNEIRHLVTIPNPPLLADFELMTDGVFGNSLVNISGDIYVAASDGRIYSLNQSKKKFDASTTRIDENVTFISSANEGNAIYILTEEGSVYEGSALETSLAQTTIENDRWVDMVTYANRVYLLRSDESGNPAQIVRFNKNGSTFSEGSEWIDSNTSALTNVRSLAIDGTIYILLKNGTVHKFESGTESSWDIGIVDPPLTNATKIWTDAESEYVYILEADTQRLVVFEKNSGEFVVQYRSDSFVGLSDFIVDESGYTIYLLAGSKLFSIAPSHLK